VRYGSSDGYYEEAREVAIIPEGSQSEPGTLIGVGPGLCELPRTYTLGRWVNRRFY
jgi:hypothetical protein